MNFKINAKRLLAFKKEMEDIRKLPPRKVIVKRIETKPPN